MRNVTSHLPTLSQRTNTGPSACPFWMALLIVLVPGSAMAGCGSAYQKLPPEKSVRAFGELTRSAAALPCRTSRVNVAAADAPPVCMAVHQISTAPVARDRAVVLVHGVLSDSRAWRYVNGKLGVDHDLIAVDLIGCGQSDRPSPKDRGPDGYSPEALGRDVLAALRATLAEREGGIDADRPTRLVLVGHSLGGSVVLRMLSNPDLRREYADVLGRVDGAVLFTPVDAAVDPNQPSFRAIADASDVEVDLAIATGILKERVAAATRDGVCESKLAVREEADRTLEAIADPVRRKAAVAMLRQFVRVRDGKTRRIDWDHVEELTANYAAIKSPCMIVWGSRDETFPLSMGYKLAAELPRGQLRIISPGMHCLPTERPLECAALVDEFLQTMQHHAGRPRIVHVRAIPAE